MLRFVVHGWTTFVHENSGPNTDQYTWDCLVNVEWLSPVWHSNIQLAEAISLAHMRRYIFSQLIFMQGYNFWTLKSTNSVVLKVSGYTV